MPKMLLTLNRDRTAALSVLVLSLLSPVLLPAADNGSSVESRYEALLSSREPDQALRLRQLLALHWDYSMHEFPETATAVGYPGQNHRWTDLSLEAIARRKRELQQPLKALQLIRREALPPPDQLSYDLFKTNLLNQVDGARFPNELLAITQLSGVQQEVAETVSIMPADSLQDLTNIWARLKSVPRLIDQNIELLREGLAKKITPPKVTLRDVAAQIQEQTALESNPIRRAVKLRPGLEGEAGVDALEKMIDSAIAEEVGPAFQKLHRFFQERYLPGCRESIALAALPDGEAWYAFQARLSTTTRLTPQAIHQIGLSEVKRIRGEMEAVITAAGFKGSYAEFTAFLRTNRQFYFTSAADLLRTYRDIAKRADPELARLFGKLPRLPYGVLPVPAYAEKSQTTAYYLPGSPAAGRPGYFYANTYNLSARPKWEMEPLTLHEAVPGHHLQIALAQEMPDVPEFRKHSSYTAFVEGWGLYAESLGTEMGFYQDPYARFGRLTYEIWRAIRLVVDTGIHALGWTRQQAIDYFQANAGKTPHDIIVEVDRYIVWPGQALAYKIGELKIKELRAFASKELGPRFDLRAFHDQVLGSGALPLDLLEEQVKAWVAREKEHEKIPNRR